MRVISPDFSEGGNIPERFTCDGQDVSPTLRIEGVPRAAQSLVLIADDPDARSGTFTHWLMWNLAPDLAEIFGNHPTGRRGAGSQRFWKKRLRWSVPAVGRASLLFQVVRA